MIDWLLDSLTNQLDGDLSWVKIIVVDSLLNTPGRGEQFGRLKRFRFVHVLPKPTVWQGDFRVTKIDYWAKCNSLNTALCHADDGWISVIDDLSVLGPSWLKSARNAMENEAQLTLGSFRKVFNLQVTNGAIISFDDHPGGLDSRWSLGRDGGVVPFNGSSMYGHVTGPLEAFLEVNGYPELLCDSLSFEDVIVGIAIERANFSFVYDRSMMIYESEELHHSQENFSGKRIDKGISPNDKSHEVLRRVMHDDYSIWNWFNLRSLRYRCLRGEPFPIPKGPHLDWYDNQPLIEL